MFRESGLSNTLISKHSSNENKYQPIEHIIETSDMHEYELKFTQPDYGLNHTRYISSPQTKSPLAPCSTFSSRYIRHRTSKPYVVSAYPAIYFEIALWKGEKRRRPSTAGSIADNLLNPSNPSLVFEICATVQTYWTAKNGNLLGNWDKLSCQD